MISPSDRRRLEALHRRLKELENSSSFSVSVLEELTGLFGEFANHEQIELAKLADLRRHLTPSLTPRTFGHLIVPVERALKKNIADDDFLITDTDRATTEQPRLPLALLVHNLRSAFNVGSILRTADGLGVEKVFLTGYTPTPDEDKTARTALGAQNIVPWEHHDSIEELLGTLRAQGYRLIACETAQKAKALTDEFPREKTVFILGSERFGLDRELLALCDEVRELPLVGTKNSLNVAVIAGIAAFEWSRQWNR